jgi:hypothetical protein
MIVPGRLISFSLAHSLDIPTFPATSRFISTTAEERPCRTGLVRDQEKKWIEPAARTVYAGVISIDTQKRREKERQGGIIDEKAKKKGDRGLVEYTCNLRRENFWST